MRMDDGGGGEEEGREKEEEVGSEVEKVSDVVFGEIMDEKEASSAAIPKGKARKAEAGQRSKMSVTSGWKLGGVGSCACRWLWISKLSSSLCEVGFGGQQRMRCRMTRFTVSRVCRPV